MDVLASLRVARPLSPAGFPPLNFLGYPPGQKRPAKSVKGEFKVAEIRLLAGALAASIAISLGVSANGATPDIHVGAAAQVVNRVYGSLESTGQSQWLRPGLDVFDNEQIFTA